MASIGIHSSATNNLLRPSFFTPNQNSLPNQFLPIANKIKKPRKHRVSSSTSSTLVSHPDKNAKGSIFVERIDYWMHESVSEIVKNLKRAPLLVQVYSGDEDGKKLKIRMEKAVSDNWAAVKGEWGNGGSRTPDGLIFVEELGQEGSSNPDQEFGEGGVSRAWGIVIQGQGVDCGPACYLLKTNRVCAGMGLGSCTHFCLMRVENLRDGAFEQFKDSWLLT